VPARGGLVTRLSLDGEQVLFLDEKTLHDPGQNVRGGLPVLFPIAGKLEGDGYELDGSRYALKQHGFARKRPFAAIDESTGPGRAGLTLELGSDDETRAVFPFDFELRLMVDLEVDRLTVTTRIANPGSKPLPLHLGFHPYFLLPDAHKAAARVVTGPATVAFDNLTRRRGEVPPLRLDVPEIDLHLLDHGPGRVRLERGTGLRPVDVTLEAPFGVVVIWTLAGKDYVCVEPWTAPGGALATGEGLLFVAPGDEMQARFAITLG
jgi:galactose mutarotase-like enzyme